LRNTLAKYADNESIIETVSKLGYRFTPRVTISEPEEDTIIVEKQTVQYFRGEEIITIDDDFAERRREKNTFFSSSRFLLALVALIALFGIGAVFYQSNFKTDARNTGLDIDKNETVKNVPIDVNPIKIGSIVHLQNRSSDDGSYLDAWGDVSSNPRFWQVPTEVMFVSTHKNPNRDKGSGSWKIVSTDGKTDGESLAVGDRIHLKNMYPNAGYLDACGWVEHLPMFRSYSSQSGTVFTTNSPDRDSGSGTWTVRSATRPDGNLISEGDSIALESNLRRYDAGKFRIAGFLNVAGKVKEIPSFNDYDGASLVFTQNRSNGQPIIDIWTITVSKTDLK